MKLRIWIYPILLGIVLVFIFSTFYFFKTYHPLKQELVQIIPKSIMDKYHFNDSWYTQYFRFMKEVITYDLGSSFGQRNSSVNQLIGQKIFSSISFLLVPGLIIFLSFFIPYKKKPGKFHKNILLLSMILISLINIIIISQIWLKSIIIITVFMVTAGIIYFKNKDTFINTLGFILIVLCSYQLFLVEELLRIPGISIYNHSSNLKSDYTLIWGIQYTEFLLATGLGVLLVYACFLKNKISGMIKNTKKYNNIA